MPNRTDHQLRDVLAELDWNPEVDASRIGVGTVANNIEVQLDPKGRRDDTELAHAALSVLGWKLGLPLESITVAVEDGWITLEGTVGWEFQSRAAEETVRSLRGLRGLSNVIAVVPRVRSADVKTRIEAALHRSAAMDARNIAVETKDGSVTLRGRVRSWAEREDAVKAAWAAPGVRTVVDHIAVQP